MADALTKTGSPSPVAAMVGQGRGQRVRRSDPAVPDQPLVAIAEAARDRRSGQVHDGVDTLDRPRVGPVRLPVALVRRRRRPPHETDDAMTAGGEERAQGGADETGGTRHGHGQWSRTQRRHGSMCGQVGGELPVPVAERLHECGPGHGCLHDVGDPCGRTRHRIKGVRVAPPQRQRHELVHELARRLVPAVLCHPAQPTGQAQHGLPVSQRRSLLQDPDRLPGRRQARRARPVARARRTPGPRVLR